MAGFKSESVTGFVGIRKSREFRGIRPLRFAGGAFSFEDAKDE
jgi:hypothetical protein